MRVAETEPPLSEARDPLLSPLIDESFKMLVLPILDLYGGEKSEIALRDVRLRFRPDFGTIELLKLLIEDISRSETP